MLSSAPALTTSSDLNYFSKPESVASSSSSVITTTHFTSTHIRLPPLPTPVPDFSFEPPRKRRRKSDDDDDLWLPSDAKKSRSSSSNSLKSSKRASRPSSTASRNCESTRSTLSPEPIYRNSRSRSTSTFPNIETPVLRDFWVGEDGSPGQGFLSAEVVVKGLMRMYKGYFKNLDDLEDKSFEPHPTNYPVAELEYPNSAGCERFMLLAPKDKDHYNPIFCLEKSLYTIVECYLTPAQQSLFGTIPTDILSDVPTPPPSPSPSPSPSPPSSQASDTSSSSSSLTSLSSASSFWEPKVNYLRAIQRAIHRQDGPLFLKTVDAVNNLLRTLKYPPLPDDAFDPTPINMIKEAVHSWSTTGIPKKVLLRILEETYQRSVGPHIPSLHRYEAFSSEVYGELMPSFTSDIIAATGLHQDSLFLDLGSGVGNVVIQASLQTGCRSYGIEIMPTPAMVAREQLHQFKKRCRMWGVSSGEVELEEGDMLKSQRVSELISQADVVLVNNKVFLEPLNEALRPKFLDLKEGAIVVSLKPFVSSLNARVTERNVDDISAIFEVTERPYHSGSVSWGSGGGSYYLHRVDRVGYAKIREQFENSRAGSMRSARSRRW